MKDSEIIKALECFIRDEGCKGCPFIERGCFECTDIPIEFWERILNLINRQKAEIERLKVLVDEMSGYFPSCINCEGKTTLGERTDKCVYVFDDYDFDYCTRRGLDNIHTIGAENHSLKEQIKVAKSEAIKDFAEELEYFVLNEDIEIVEPKCKDYKSYINGANQFRHQIKNGINDLVKEMTEGEE